MSKFTSKKLIQALGYLFVFLFTLIFALIALVLFIWIKPETVINENNIKKALTYTPENIQKILHLEWTQLGIHFESPRFSEKIITLKTDNFCLVYRPSLDLCLSKVNISVHFSLMSAGGNFKPRIIQISNLEVLVSHLNFTQGPPVAETPEESSFLPNLKLPAFESFIPEALDFAQIQRIQIGAEKIKIQLYPKAGEPPSPPLQAELALTRNTILDEQEVFLNLTGTLNKEGVFKTSVLTDISLTHRKLKILGRMNLTTKGLSVSAPLDLEWDKTLNLKSKALVSYPPKIHIRPDLNISWSEQNLNIKIKDLSSANLWKGGHLGLGLCDLNIKLENTEGYPEDLKADCTVAITPAKKIPGVNTINTRITAAVHINSSELRNLEQITTTGKVRVDGQHEFLAGFIEYDGEFVVSNFKKPELRKAQGNIILDLKIPKFGLWKAVLEKTPFAIPAPLHVLKGQVELKSQAQMESWTLPIKGTARVQTRLTSKNQKLNTTLDVKYKTLGSLAKLSGLDLEVTALLEEIQLEAPPLRLEKPPQLLPDSRFVLKKEAPDLVKKVMAQKEINLEVPFLLNWKVAVKTVKDIKILSNLIKTPIPIAVDLLATKADGLKGSVQLQRLPVELLKRKADIQYVKLIFHPGSKTPELDGLIGYKNPEVDIKIMILGNTEKPRIEFESEPPLNRQQIISVLLFNKSLDELNEEEVSSTSSVSKAMSDGALGLFTLMFLSDTPIQSISYDPTSKSYTARLKIDDSTSFSLGSDFEDQRQFTLRRRLGGPWSIRTELQQSSESADKVLTLLEWLKRF